MTEDLGAFFNADEFATTATYNGSVSVNIIHDPSYSDRFGAARNSSMALGKASDFSVTSVGKTLAFGGITYKVQSVEPDAPDVVLLELARA